MPLYRAQSDLRVASGVDTTDATIDGYTCGFGRCSVDWRQREVRSAPGRLLKGRPYQWTGERGVDPWGSRANEAVSPLDSGRKCCVLFQFTGVRRPDVPKAPIVIRRSDRRYVSRRRYRRWLESNGPRPHRDRQSAAIRPSTPSRCPKSPWSVTSPRALPARSN